MVTWADAVAAVGTTLAAVVAVALAVREAALGRRDRAERTASAEREQAARIFAWESYSGIGTDHYEPELIGIVQEVSVQNGSAGPVFDVSVYFGDPRLPPSRATSWHVPVLLPGDTQTWSNETDYSGGEVDDTAILRSVDPLLRVGFRDAAGRHWERETDGNLKRRNSQHLAARGDGSPR